MGLGTWGLSGDGYGPVDEAEAERTILRSLDIGFNLFDTADAYGAGRMERLLGRALADHPSAVIVTKGGTDRTTEPPRKRFDAEYVRTSVERSLKRLGRERIPVYLLHNPSADALATGDATGALKDLKKQGLVAHWGASVGDVEAARLAIQGGAEVIELAYNLLHSQDLHRLAGDLLVTRVGVLARSPLAYGMLSGGWAKDREFSPGDHRNDRWTRLELEKRVEQLGALRYLVHGDVGSLRAAAVRFVLSNQLVAAAVLGPRSVAQLEELVRETGAGPHYLPDEDLAQLPRTLEAVGIPT